MYQLGCGRLPLEPGLAAHSRLYRVCVGGLPSALTTASLNSRLESIIRQHTLTLRFVVECLLSELLVGNELYNGSESGPQEVLGLGPGLPPLLPRAVRPPAARQLLHQAPQHQRAPQPRPGRQASHGAPRLVN